MPEWLASRPLAIARPPKICINVPWWNVIGSFVSSSSCVLRCVALFSNQIITGTAVIVGVGGVYKPALAPDLWLIFTPAPPHSTTHPSQPTWAPRQSSLLSIL